MEENISICCGSRLTHYNEKWQDGLCSKCGNHSAAKGSRSDDSVEKDLEAI
tara:strand:+ start:276 stop:428 length:153 start_codon:yes stop_codon:yes gene_type:complete